MDFGMGHIFKYMKSSSSSLSSSSSSSSSSGKAVLEPPAEAFQLLSTLVATTPTDGRYGGWAYSDGPHMFITVHQSQRHDSTHPRLFNWVGYQLYICKAPANWQHWDLNPWPVHSESHALSTQPPHPAYMKYNIKERHVAVTRQNELQQDQILCLAHFLNLAMFKFLNIEMSPMNWTQDFFSLTIDNSCGNYECSLSLLVLCSHINGHMH